MMYFFPFNEVKNNSKIIIYGGGDVGRQYLRQILCSNYCHCLFIADRNFKKLHQQYDVEVCAPEQINSCEYDKVVIASAAFDEEIYNSLLELNVS